MRKSIFDIASESINMENEVKRILTIAKTEKTLCVDDCFDYTIFDFVDEYCFEDWKYRGHFINVNDFLSTLNFNKIVSNAKTDAESLLILIELIYNFWFLCHQKLEEKQSDYSFEWCGNFYHLRQIMDDILEKYNHTIAVDEDRILVVEDNEAVTAVAEILPQKLSTNVIKYNHRSLQGEIEAKKSILLSLGAELEPKRKILSDQNKQLEDDIFYMLNNINLRHNNCNTELESKYKEYVAKMPNEELENWYDELYQMMLLAFLLLDNVERTKKIKELKRKIVGG